MKFRWSGNGFCDLTGQHEDGGPDVNIFRGAASENAFCELTDENESIWQGNMMTRSVVDLASVSFEAQLKIMRKTTVLVGLHGNLQRVSFVKPILKL